jgi:hypothetical protein
MKRDPWQSAMLRGDWEEAWRETDRLEGPRRVAQAHAGFERRPWHLVWDGTPLAGRSVLVRCAHGLGDTLQFIRFLPELSRICREVTLLVQPQLLALLQDAPGLGRVLDGWTDAPPPPYEVEIEIMELAYALRANSANLPPPYPHLNARVAGRPALPQDGRLRVGILWAASDWDTTRSIPFSALAPILDVPGTRFFSLQQGRAAAEPLLHPRISVEHLSPRTVDVVSAAAAMVELDLVITVDGMPAHLGATLGRPTWVLLKHDADWRWMEDRADSLWYPSMRLFRQTRRGDWAAPIRAAAEALSALGSRA